jgi:hypothetical protein
LVAPLRVSRRGGQVRVARIALIDIDQLPALLFEWDVAWEAVKISSV